MANSTQNSQLNDLATKVELLSFMECPVCTEVPFPPIYMCNKGHNICENCKPKLKECPTCRGSLSAEARNYAVEQMVLASKHCCCYKDEGCRIELRGDLMETHMKNCSYRPFKCPWFGQDNCSTDLLKLTQAKAHFLQNHLENLWTGTTKIVRHAFLFTSLTDEGSPRWLKNSLTWWPSDAIDFDGMMFVSLTFSMNQTICFALFCVGSEEDAQKYRVKIICQPDTEVEMQWTLPVKSIIKATELRSSENRHSVIIPFCTLDDLLQMAEKNEADLEYRFRISYTTLKR